MTSSSLISVVSVLQQQWAARLQSQSSVVLSLSSSLAAQNACVRSLSGPIADLRSRVTATLPAPLNIGLPTLTAPATATPFTIASYTPVAVPAKRDNHLDWQAEDRMAHFKSQLSECVRSRPSGLALTPRPGSSAATSTSSSGRSANVGRGVRLARPPAPSSTRGGSTRSSTASPGDDHHRRDRTRYTHPSVAHGRRTEVSSRTAIEMRRCSKLVRSVPHGMRLGLCFYLLYFSCKHVSANARASLRAAKESS